MISPKKNLWHCLGACQAGGSVIDWVMRAEGVSFRHAVELLRADDHPLRPPGESGGREAHDGARSCRRRSSGDADDGSCCGRWSDYYHETLKQSPGGAGVSGEARPDASGDDRALPAGLRQPDAGLPAAGRRTARRARRCAGRLQRLGDAARVGARALQRLAGVPGLRSLDGEVVGDLRAQDHGEAAEGTPLHLYLPGPHRGVWNEEALSKLEGNHPVRVADRRADVLVRGVPQRDGQLRRERLHRRPPGGVRQHGPSRCWIAYDRDEAGDKAARALAEELTGDGHRVLPGAVSARAWTRTSTR